MIAVEPTTLWDEWAPSIKPGAKKMSDIFLDDFSNEAVTTTINSIDRSGQISYLVASAGSKGTTYQVTQDYMKFRTLEYDDTTAYRVGVGLRIRAYVTVNANNVNLNGLAALGLAAAQNKIYGSIQMEVLGLSGRDITNALPLPSQISQESIAAVIQAMATIKSHIYDGHSEDKPDGGVTVVAPVMIARRLRPSEIAGSEAGSIQIH